MKYVDGDGKVRTLVAERHPFKGVETTSQTLSYTRFFRDRRESPARGLYYGNKADVEPEAEEECLWELNLLVTSVNKLDVNNTANNIGEWYINEELDLVYFFMFASDSAPSDTSTDIDDDPWSTIDALSSLHAPVRSCLTVYQNISDVRGFFFEVPTRCKDQKLIFFGRVESKPTIHEDS